MNKNGSNKGSLSLHLTTAAFVAYSEMVRNESPLRCSCNDCFKFTPKYVALVALEAKKQISVMKAEKTNKIASLACHTSSREGVSHLGLMPAEMAVGGGEPTEPTPGKARKSRHVSNGDNAGGTAEAGVGRDKSHTRILPNTCSPHAPKPCPVAVPASSEVAAKLPNNGQKFARRCTPSPSWRNFGNTSANSSRRWPCCGWCCPKLVQI